MALFTNNTLAQNVIDTSRAAAAPKETIFEKYVRMTREKIEQSISDAQGRYELDQAYAQAKPSQNWKVVKEAPAGAELTEEIVEVWLKIGIKKQEIVEGQTSARIKAVALIPTLNEFLALMERIESNPKSEEATSFHNEAIEAAKPKSNPKMEGKDGWEYDQTIDQYVAV